MQAGMRVLKSLVLQWFEINQKHETYVILSYTFMYMSVTTQSVSRINSRELLTHRL